MKYENMSWLEINHAIAEILEPNATQIQESRFNAFEDEHSVEVFVDDDIIEYDFSKPQDAWSIIVNNKICIQWYSDDCGDYASASIATDDEENNSHMTDMESALLAAMICFLKMKDAESNQ